MENSKDKVFSQIKRGDKQAFQQLFNQYYRYLTTIAWRILRDEGAAQDIAQESFIELWKRHAELPEDLMVKSYLSKITVNKSLNYIKKQSRVVFVDDAMDVLSEEIIEDHQKMDFDSMESLINHTVDNLPKKCRIIFSMSRFEQMKHKEIAEKLNISTKTVENQITIALKRIRMVLKKNAFLGVILVFLIQNKFFLGG